MVGFRIPNRMLVFVRSRSEVPGRAFVAEAELTVQLYRDGISVGTQVWRQLHYAATFEEAHDRTTDLEGRVRLDVAPGTYGYRLFLKDGHSGRLVKSTTQPVVVPDFETLVLGSAFMTQTLETRADEVELTPINLGGDAPYGQAVQAIVPVGVPALIRPEDVTLRYTLRRLDEEAKRREAGERERRWAAMARPEEGTTLPMREAAQTISAGGVVVASGEQSGASFLPVTALQEVALDAGYLRLTAVPPDAATGYLAPLDLKGERLDDGAYVLDLTLVADHQSFSTATRFQTHWQDMPLSLYDPDVAIRNLVFLVGRTAMKAMRKGSKQEKEARIRAFWAERDPTPETSFNELMAEYYRRVDAAAVRFRTGTFPAPDGLTTDQARIFIVHGPPDSVERMLPHQGGVEEHWAYISGQQFVFWAASSLEPFQLLVNEDR